MRRDNARTPMQWDDTEHAGFTTVAPSMPVNPNHAETDARAALADEASVLHHYRRLIDLRHAEPAVAHGDFHMVLPDHDQGYAFVPEPGPLQIRLTLQPWAARVLLLRSSG